MSMPRALNTRWTIAALFATAVAVVAALAGQHGSVGSLLPHGYCFTWNPALLWTHVVSDTLIGAAYVSIPLTLLQLVRKRTDLPFNWVVLLFAVFILSCGATHWIEVWTVWNPDYWLSGNVKALTAIASVLTAAALIRLLPKILAIPTVSDLTAARDALQAEVGHRGRAEEALLLERADLERRVQQRTSELTFAIAAAAAAHSRAEEANRLKDRFLAKVSHELRTPLQSTLTWAQLLHRTPDDAKRAAQASERILHNVRTQARLIDDLLDISRVLSGKLSLQLQAIEPAQVVRKAVDVVRSASARRGVELVLEVTGGEGASIDSDPVRLEQVVWNLINNAVQASAEGGRVRVRYELTDRLLTLEVRDWGRGIARDQLAHIFEPFRQGSNSDNSHRGLGLGLAITRSIVELFHGELTAHSDGTGQGATFLLRLPVSLEVPVAAKICPVLELTDDESLQLRGLRILYVEDEPDIAEGGRLMLDALGADVLLCLDFDDAVTRIASGRFDVFLSDLHLGAGRTALELIRLLRAAPHGARVPAIVFSASGSEDDRQASLQAGFAEHLVKPAEAALVARALLDVLRASATSISRLPTTAVNA